MSIRENVLEVRERIADAAREAGRDPAGIVLVGASKMNDADACRQAIAAGIDALGENRVQEMVRKAAEGAYQGAPLHFIGHLQRNKVRQVVGHVDLIQSAGSDPLLLAIEKAAAAWEEDGRPGFVQPVLLEVNVAGEASKSGYAPDRLLHAAETALSLPHVRVDGLMAIPPADASPDQDRRYLDEVRALYIDMDAKMFHNSLRYLSMGMSGDFEDAVRAGATMVRVGTAIFGARNYG